jgi:hypothetical protein
MSFPRWRLAVIGVLFMVAFINARPYLHGVVGGSDKVKLNQRAQKAASNYVYAQELMEAIAHETQPSRREELIQELRKIKPIN